MEWTMWSTKGISIYCFNNQKEYSSMNQAARELNLSHHGLRRVVLGLNSNCKGYVFGKVINGEPQAVGKAKDYLDRMGL